MSCFFCNSNNARNLLTLNRRRFEICMDCHRFLSGNISCSRCSCLMNYNFENSEAGFNLNDRGEIRCNRCLSENIVVSPFTVIRDNFRSYGYKPTPIFHPRVSQQDNLFMGMELEMGLANNNAIVTNFCNNHGGKIFYFKSDCSIRAYGCEVVTHPCTLEYHKSEESGWKQLLQDAISAGFHSGTSANTGIHVHMNKNFFDNKHIKKIDLFINSYRDVWEKIARRSNNGYCAYSVKRHQEWGNFGGSRYSSLNLSNSATIEMRIFCGTLDYNVVMATLEFCHALAFFSKNVTYEDLYENQSRTKENFKNLLYNHQNYHFAETFCRMNRIF